jgi:hypothetical protein
MPVHLPLILYAEKINKMLIRKLSYRAAFLMVQAYKITSLSGAVIVYLKFIFHATPLIYNCLT